MKIIKVKVRKDENKYHEGTKEPRSTNLFGIYEKGFGKKTYNLQDYRSDIM
jgi:hypothetical protein